MKEEKRGDGGKKVDRRCERREEEGEGKSRGGTIHPQPTQRGFKRIYRRNKLINYPTNRDD